MRGPPPRSVCYVPCSVVSARSVLWGPRQRRELSPRPVCVILSSTSVSNALFLLLLQLCLFPFNLVSCFVSDFLHFYMWASGPTSASSGVEAGTAGGSVLLRSSSAGFAETASYPSAGPSPSTTGAMPSYPWDHHHHLRHHEAEVSWRVSITSKHNSMPCRLKCIAAAAAKIRFDGIIFPTKRRAKREEIELGSLVHNRSESSSSSTPGLSAIHLLFFNCSWASNYPHSDG